MRDRLLTRHFLRRFLEHDLIASNADRRDVLAVTGAALMAVSLFVAALLALQYQFAHFMPPGMASLQALDDRFLFVSASMLVMALLAVAQWHALSLDARDTAVLGILPISRAAIIRSKFAAVALLAAVTGVGWNLSSTLLRGVSLPMKLSVGLNGVLVLTLAHFVVTLAAGAFGFLSVLGLREGLTAVLGSRRFQSISSALQAALVVLLLSALLLLPGSYSGFTSAALARDAATTKFLPPLWFVGLHETLAGSVIDSLPRVEPQRFLVVRERRATELYRSLWPRYRQLSLYALVALPAVSLVTIAAWVWNSWRLPTPVMRRPRQTANRAWHRIARTLAPSSPAQAGFWFTLQTLPRRVSHRIVLASSLAVGLSLMVITVGSRVLTIHRDVTKVPVAILAAQSLLLAALVTGVHHAVQLPAELRASSTFSLAWSGELRPYVSGVKRAAWLVAVLPTLAVLLLWHALLLGLGVAVLHLGVGLAFSMLVMEALFLHYPGVPLASPYVPRADGTSRGFVYVVGMFSLSWLLAWIERFALRAPLGYAALVGGVVSVAAAVAAFDHAGHRPSVVVDVDEVPQPPTQRLDLTG